MLKQRPSDKTLVIGAIIGVVVLIAVCSLLLNIIGNIFTAAAFVPLAAGVLLLLGNRSGLMELIQTRQPSPTVFNALIGIALLCFGAGAALFDSTFFRLMFYAPGLGLLLLALPLALSKPAMYDTYRQWFTQAKGVMARRKKNAPAQGTQQPYMPYGSPPPLDPLGRTPNETVRLDPNDPSLRQ